MPLSPVARFSELRLVLEPEHGELVRAYVHEAALAGPPQGLGNPHERQV